MKKLALFIIMALPFMLVSCNQEMVSESETVANTEVGTDGFNVIEEATVSENQMLAGVTDAFQQYASKEILDNLSESFKKSSEELEPTGGGSRAIIGTYKTVRVTYQTVDEHNKPVTASALIVYPLFKKLKNVMLINHGTVIGSMMIPTKYTSVEALLAATGSLCIMPDYLGHGVAANHPDLYLNAEVEGKTSVDALLKLLDYAKEKKLPLASDFKTYITGYSQGGAVSLAALRRIQQLDKKTQKSLHIAKAYCGGCPADLRLTFETYLSESKEGKPLGLGSVVPAVINSMFNSYPEELADMSYEKCFTPYALMTGVPQAIRENRENALDMMLPLEVTIDKVLNKEYILNNPENLERLLSMMDRQNLCKGWKPEYPIRLLHGNPDGIVPYGNLIEAYHGLNNEYMERPIVVKTTKNAMPIIQHIEPMLVMMADILSGNI